MKQIGVGVVGCGFVGRGAHVPSFDRIESARLVAIADQDPQVREKIKRKYSVDGIYDDYRRLVEDPAVELVVVSVPTPLHAEVALAAIEAKKHVLCEMPLAVSLAEGEQVVEAARRAGVVLMPSLTYRFTPTFVKVKEMIEQGAIGEPVSFAYREFIPAADLAKQWPAESWMWDFARSGGPLFTLAVWSIDMLRWLSDSEIVRCEANRYYCRLAQLQTSGYDASVSLSFATGVVGSLQYSGSIPNAGAECMLSVVGDESKMLRCWDNDRVEILGDDPTRVEWNVKQHGPRMWGHEQQNSHLIDALLAGDAPAITPRDGIVAMEIAEQIAGDR